MTKTVIVAVHDPNIRYLLQRYAEESGFRTVSAACSKDVLALLAQKENPALIILDAEREAPLAQHLQAWPLGAANQTLWHIVKVEAAARHVPIVVYAGLDEPGADRCDGAGPALPPVAACLPKSVMFDDFVAALIRAGVYLEAVSP